MKNLNERLKALEQRHQDLSEQLGPDLGSRIQSLESSTNESYQAVKKRLEKIADHIDTDFDFYWEKWQRNHEPVDKVKANFLLQTMAVLNTQGYKRRKAKLEQIAFELDIPNYTPLHLTALIEEPRIKKTVRRIKRKSRVLFHQQQAGFYAKKDESYQPLLIYLQQLCSVLKQNQ